MELHSSKCYLYALLFGILVTNVSIAQNDFASIRKNVNVLANSLKHDLCETKDTLILQGEERIKRIYTIGENTGLVDEYLFTKDYTLPLNSFRNGRYVFVVYESRKRIVFEINILNNDFPDAVQMLESNSVVSLTTENGKHSDLTNANGNEPDLMEFKVKPKPYNISNKERDGMQSREEVRRLMAIERERKRAEIKSKIKNQE